MISFVYRQNTINIEDLNLFKNVFSHVQKNDGNLDPSTKITGGGMSDANEYPWQVKIIIDGQSLCGGTIIGRNIFSRKTVFKKHKKKKKYQKVLSNFQIFCSPPPITYVCSKYHDFFTFWSLSSI